MKDEILISVVCPVYIAEYFVHELVKQLETEISIITDKYEIILVEDHGPDNSWKMIEDLAKSNKKVRGIKLSKNFGQHYAITAGLDASKGTWVVVIDCDLQDRPDQIHKFYNKALEGYDVVLGKREKRKDSLFKTFSSWLFYKILGYLSGYKQDNSIANFGIYNRKVVDAIIGMREKIRFFPTMVVWVGFKRTEINIEHSARAEGKSSYNFSRLLNLGLDIILAYSDKPLRLIVRLGLLTSFFSLLYAFYNLYKFINGDIIVLGYTSLIVSVWFLSGIIMLTLGVIGLYIGKTFEGVKNRPLYLIDKTVN